MAFGDAGVKAFGLREIKLVVGATLVSLNAAQTMTFKERVKSGELSGNDKTLAVVASSDALEWELEEGGISMQAYGLITGRTPTLSGIGDGGGVDAERGRADGFPVFQDLREVGRGRGRRCSCEGVQGEGARRDRGAVCRR
jgi:hypothetical protein